MKTPLQELIERLEEKKNYHEKGSNFFVALGLAKQIATELLEKEREIAQEYAKQSKQEEDNELRKVAEKVVVQFNLGWYRHKTREAIDELEKALNQNK